MGHEIFTVVPSATANAIFNTSGNGNAVVGHVEKVVFQAISWANGSCIITDKTTGETVFAGGNISGTNPTTFYPLRWADLNSNGVTLSGLSANVFSKPYVHGPLNFSGLGLGSTTAGTTGSVWVYFETEG